LRYRLLSPFLLLAGIKREYQIWDIGGEIASTPVSTVPPREYIERRARLKFRGHGKYHHLHGAPDTREIW
jgi:hypothetical protein